MVMQKGGGLSTRLDLKYRVIYVICIDCVRSTQPLSPTGF